MNENIREMRASDKTAVLEMMRDFYSSPAVFTNGSEEIFNRDIDNCIGDCPFVEGYVFDGGDTLQGYAMLAKSYSTEFGRECIWIEDVYIKPEFRGMGIAGSFLSFVHQKYSGAIFRLEVEEDNEGAVRFYKSYGYDFLPYAEMKK